MCFFMYRKGSFGWIQPDICISIRLEKTAHQIWSSLAKMADTLITCPVRYGWRINILFLIFFSITSIIFFVALLRMNTSSAPAPSIGFNIQFLFSKFFKNFGEIFLKIRDGIIGSRFLCKILFVKYLFFVCLIALGSEPIKIFFLLMAIWLNLSSIFSVSGAIGQKASLFSMQDSQKLHIFFLGVYKQEFLNFFVLNR